MPHCACSASPLIRGPFFDAKGFGTGKSIWNWYSTSLQRNRYYDVRDTWITLSLWVYQWNTFWVLFKNKCLFAVYEKKAIDPNYKLGDCPGLSALNCVHPTGINVFRVAVVLGWAHVILTCAPIPWVWRFLLFALQLGFFLWGYFRVAAVFRFISAVDLFDLLDIALLAVSCCASERLGAVGAKGRAANKRFIPLSVRATLAVVSRGPQKGGQNQNWKSIFKYVAIVFKTTTRFMQTREMRFSPTVADHGSS